MRKRVWGEGLHKRQSFIGELCGKADQRRWESCNWNEAKRGSIQSKTRHEKSRKNKRVPSSKAKYYLVTDSEAVPWGKGEKDPGRGVKENLKPYVYKQTEHIKVRCRTFCRTVRRVIVYGEIKYYVRYEVEGKPSMNSAKKSYVIDPKPSDLSMVRMKVE